MRGRARRPCELKLFSSFLSFPLLELTSYLPLRWSFRLIDARLPISEESLLSLSSGFVD